MPIKKLVETPENLFNYPPQIEPKPKANNTFIFKEISRELEEFLLRENGNADSTDGVFEFLAEMSNQVQEEFT